VLPHLQKKENTEHQRQTTSGTSASSDATSVGQETVHQLYTECEHGHCQFKVCVSSWWCSDEIDCDNSHRTGHDWTVTLSHNGLNASTTFNSCVLENTALTNQDKSSPGESSASLTLTRSLRSPISLFIASHTTGYGSRHSNGSGVRRRMVSLYSAKKIVSSQTQRLDL